MQGIADVLNTVRDAVGRVTLKEMGGMDPQAPLLLDSLSRIRLILELENCFSIELDNDDAVPEVFENLASLVSFVERQRQRQG